MGDGFDLISQSGQLGNKHDDLKTKRRETSGASITTPKIIVARNQYQFFCRAPGSDFLVGCVRPTGCRDAQFVNARDMDDVRNARVDRIGDSIRDVGVQAETNAARFSG